MNPYLYFSSPINVILYPSLFPCVVQTNHVCEYYEDTSVCSTATQISSPVIDPETSKPWEGERFLIVGTKRNAAALVQVKLNLVI